MKSTSILTTNHFQSKSRSQILPKSPLISSQNLDLPQVQFDYYQFSSHETPNHCHVHHVLAIALNKFNSERKLDSILQTEHQFFGSVSIIPANVEHWSAWRKTGIFACISIHPDFIANVAYEFVNSDKVELIPTFSQAEHFISGISLAIKHELETNVDGCQLYLESLFHQLAVYLIQKYATKKTQLNESVNGLSSSQLKYILELINDNISSEISVNKMADYLSLSPFHFSREFKKSVGVSPHNYVMQQRVEMAKRILKQQKLPIAEVALECGFSNQSHLGRTFKKHTGVTPKKFRLDNW